MTEAQVLAFSNGKFVMSVYEQNDIQSYRDLIHYVAGSGRPCVHRPRGQHNKSLWHDARQEMVTPAFRFASALSDFETRFTAISSNYDVTQTGGVLQRRAGRRSDDELGKQSAFAVRRRSKPHHNASERLTMISSFHIHALRRGNSGRSGNGYRRLYNAQRRASCYGKVSCATAST